MERAVDREFQLDKRLPVVQYGLALVVGGVLFEVWAIVNVLPAVESVGLFGVVSVLFIFDFLFHPRNRAVSVCDVDVIFIRPGSGEDEGFLWPSAGANGLGIVCVGGGVCEGGGTSSLIRCHFELVAGAFRCREVMRHLSFAARSLRRNVRDGGEALKY